jgi:hypothetical protein
MLKSFDERVNEQQREVLKKFFGERDLNNRLPTQSVL